jgi:hypothetical protein
MYCLFARIAENTAHGRKTSIFFEFSKKIWSLALLLRPAF